VEIQLDEQAGAIVDMAFEQESGWGRDGLGAGCVPAHAKAETFEIPYTRLRSRSAANAPIDSRKTASNISGGADSTCNPHSKTPEFEFR
jgi:hypothetical protein